VWDENGKEYVDFLLGSGPMLVGHAHPEVTAAAPEAYRPGHDFLCHQPLGDRARRSDRRGRDMR
jgi:glutamate-1-semialdehyde 2,1-aminomutase